MATSDGTYLVKETQPKNDNDTGRTTRQKRKYPKLMKPALKRIKRLFYKKKQDGAETDTEVDQNGKTDQNTVQSVAVHDSDPHDEHSNDGEDAGQGIASDGTSSDMSSEGNTVDIDQHNQPMQCRIAIATNATNTGQDSDVDLSIKEEYHEVPILDPSIIMHLTDEEPCGQPPISLPVQFQLPMISKPEQAPQIYKLHINEVFQDKEFKRYVVGTSPLCLDPYTLASERVLMMVGATGTGKTTLINGIANYIYGTQWDDEFRLKVIDNEGQRSQAHGQTKDITAYTFPVKEDSPLPYTLTVIDSPGFGDSDGPMNDQYIVEQINEFFSLAPPKGITTLHGIGFVVKASDGRLTPMQQYIILFNSILSIFGRDVEDNIFVMITFCDAEKPVVLNALKEAAIPFHGNGFKFLYADNCGCNDGESDDDDNDIIDFNFNFWKMGMKSFKKFFKHFETAEAKSLQLTIEVLEERKQLELLIQGLRQQIVSGMGKLNELQQEEMVLSRHKEDVEANKNFNYEVDVTERVKRETNKRVTNCVVCGFTCHRNCVYNKDKYNCRVMKENHCIVCPGKCHYSSHVNNPFYFETVVNKEIRTYGDLKERYEHATSKLSRSEAVLGGLHKELDKVQIGVLATVQKAHRTLRRLDEIALNPDPLTETDYIKLCIETEKREAKPNWAKRVEYFDEMLLQGKCISSVMDLPLMNASDAIGEGDEQVDLAQLPHDPTDQESNDGTAKCLMSILSYNAN